VMPVPWQEPCAQQMQSDYVFACLLLVTAVKQEQNAAMQAA